MLRSLRQLPRPVAPPLPCSSRVNIVYLYFTNCDPCESEYLRLFDESVTLWTRDIAPKSVHVEANNYLKKQDIGRVLFDVFNVSRNMFGHSLLFIYGDGEGFVFSFPDGDHDIPAAIRYLARNAVSGSLNFPRVQAAVTFGLGLMVGTDPCFIAVMSSLYVSSDTTKKHLAGRVLAIAIGTAYAYIVLSFASLRAADLWSSLPLTWLTALVAVFLAVALLIDGLYGLLARLRGLQESPLLFKTPKKLASEIRRLIDTDSLVTDMLLGTFLAVFKLPCMAPQLLIVMLSSPGEFLPNVVAFASGILSSAIAMAVLVVLGIICTDRLIAVRWYGRSIQRIVIGTIMGWTAFKLLS